MRIGQLLNCYRRLRDIGIRKLAKEIGIGHATLSRIERGENFDAETMTKVMLWMLSRPSA